MSPVSSATGTNDAGRSSPREGCDQRSERLEPLDRARGKAHERLIEEVQLLRLHRVAQVAFELDALGRRVAHRRVEHRHGVTTGLLGPVHRRVRVTDESLGVERRIGTVGQGHADTGGRDDLDAAHVERDLQAETCALGHLECLARRRQTVEDDHELVSTDASDQIAGPSRRAEPTGHGEQQLVTQTVAVAVVDELEPVDVEEEERDEPAVLLRVGEHRIEVVLGERAVRKASERVVRRRVGEAFLRSGVCTQGSEHPPRRGERQRHDDRPERHAVAGCGVDPEHGDQGGERQRDGNERQPALRRRELVCG